MLAGHPESALLAARMPAPAAVPVRSTGGSPRPVVGLLGESFHDSHVLKRTCQPEIDALRQAGFAVWLLQTGAQCRPVSGIDGVIPLLWNGQALRRGAGPALDALILLEPFGTIVDAVGAGQRWAPVQLACAVTPTPVGSPQLDYWLQGQDAPFAAEAPVLAVPGVGVTRWHEAPRPVLPWSAREGLVVASAPHKWSAPFLGWLADLVKDGVPLKLLPGSAVSAPALQQALAQVLPRRGWTLQASCSHAEYLDILSRARCALDAFPYGGLTTIADAASTGTPMLLPPRRQRNPTRGTGAGAALWPWSAGGQPRRCSEGTRLRQRRRAYEHAPSPDLAPCATRAGAGNHWPLSTFPEAVIR